MIAERWKIVEKIGEGTFSQIYLAFSVHDNKRVAVKVEAPSSLKPVLEWESSILKSLQDCDHVCRYFYHGKHAESTVLVMELLGESMSMLRVTPDAIHGVPLARCVSVGLEVHLVLLNVNQQQASWRLVVLIFSNVVICRCWIV